MTTQETIENAALNIRRAIKDYRAHTRSTAELNAISDSFIAGLAKDSTRAKQELRDLFSKSPAWDEKLDALVINGTRTHNPDYDLVRDLAHQILRPVILHNRDNASMINAVHDTVEFFTTSDAPPPYSIEAINTLAPKAYAPNKKQSRIFKAICDALQVSDDTAGSDFQRRYAQFADELTAKKIGFKLYVSLNPAHFLTMSNPKNDNRGDTLTSCHSLNSSEYGYNCGCTGYARDKWSFIVFTASDPKIPETLNNRKTTRQVFAYRPGNGLLMQSRMYNTNGGTRGAQEESKLYRDLVQRELSALEGVPNLWKTHPYRDGKEDCVEIGKGFGGYADWTFAEFDGKVSIRVDCEDSYAPLHVGTYGLCIRCANGTSSGLYCSDCGDREEQCGYCEEYCSEVYPVRMSDGSTEYVCEVCRDNYFTCCDRCGGHYHDAVTTRVDDGEVCQSCLAEYYGQCWDCGSWCQTADMRSVYNRPDHEIVVCESCCDNFYEECINCGNTYCTNVMEDGLCPDCRENEVEE